MYLDAGWMATHCEDAKFSLRAKCPHERSFVRNVKRSGDPRRRAVAIDPLREFRERDLCWCGSQKFYAACHQIRNLSAPGQPLPADPEDGFYVAPSVVVSRDAFVGNAGPAVLTNHFPAPQLIPARHGLSARVLQSGPIDPDGAYSHAEIGALRYAVLDSNGLHDPNRVEGGQLDQRLEACVDDLLDGMEQIARLTLSRLSYDHQRIDARRPVVLHHDRGDVSALVGQTLLWADHYTTADPLAAMSFRGRPATLEVLRECVVSLLRLRPLVEAGIVVPVAVDLATATLDAAIDELVRADLDDPNLFSWIEKQVIVEGPTAREAAFVHVIDDEVDFDGLYMLGKTRPESVRSTEPGGPQLGNKLFGTYDPEDDYEPWLRTVRRQAAVALAQNLGRDFAIADSFGSNLITKSPFRARALRRRKQELTAQATRPNMAGSVWAHVPWLPGADPQLLVRIAADTERVEDLRAQTEHALRGIEDSDLGSQARAVSELSKDLSAAGDNLGRELRRSKAIEMGGCGVIATGTALMGATLTPVTAAAAALAAVGAVLPVGLQARQKKRTAAFAFWMARPR